MIDYILFAEFDDLKGKVIRHSYPNEIYDEEPVTTSRPPLSDRLAEMMVPDSGNDRMIDTVFFTVNRPSVAQVNQNMRQCFKSKSSLWAKIYT